MTKMTGSSSDDWILLVLWLEVLLLTLSYNSVAILHTLQFTVAHTLGFSVSTSRLLAVDLNTETSSSKSLLSLLVSSSVTSEC
jgi:hypothetical protein